MKKIGIFDAEFDELLAAAGWTKKTSRHRAVVGLVSEIAQLKKELGLTAGRRT